MLAPVAIVISPLFPTLDEPELNDKLPDVGETFVPITISPPEAVLLAPERIDICPPVPLTEEPERIRTCPPAPPPRTTNYVNIA